MANEVGLLPEVALLRSLSSAIDIFLEKIPAPTIKR